MLQPAHERGLGGEEAFGVALVHRIGQRSGAHPLDGDVAVVEIVVREEHLAGRALAQALEHPVLADLHRHLGRQAQLETAFAGA